MFWNHPGFVESNAELVSRALDAIPAGERARTHVAFTAHSIPAAMARQCRYEAQLRETARLVASAVGVADFDLVYQSRSGSPRVPWLEPDICDHLRTLKERGVTDVVISPVGFVSDHVEVLYDLDIEARAVADELGLRMVRAATVGTHPAFVAMIRELIEERLSVDMPKRSLGELGRGHDVCPMTAAFPGRAV